MRVLVAIVLLCVSGAAASACDAGKADFAVGKPYYAGLAERARVAAGASITRQMIRGRVYTMEFRGDRLNLHTDERGRVLRVTCG
ncbi:MAG: I78 family peptidase inhibitor [Methylobacteriaceae bacterium]|nr:I78 family peptidase inhibitor [Methylobacteriaceae bacterium]